MLYRPSIFSMLPSFSGSPYFALDELHLIGHGIAKHIYQLITVDLSPTKNTHFFYTYQDGSLARSNFPFYIKRSDLKLLGQTIENSRKHIPVSFDGSFDNFIGNTEGVRAVDWLDFLLYVVPTLVVPLVRGTACKKALLSLVRGISISLQWHLDEDLIKEIEK